MFSQPALSSARHISCNSSGAQRLQRQHSRLALQHSRRSTHAQDAGAAAAQHSVHSRQALGAGGHLCTERLHACTVNWTSRLPEASCSVRPNQATAVNTMRCSQPRAIRAMERSVAFRTHLADGQQTLQSDAPIKVQHPQTSTNYQPHTLHTSHRNSASTSRGSASSTARRRACLAALVTWWQGEAGQSRA